MAKTAKKPVRKTVVRVGNFFVKRESEHYKMYDINNVWSMRVHYLSSMYTFIDILVEEDKKDMLEVIVKMYYALCTTPPDVDMIRDTYDAYMALMERMKPELKTDEEDAQELKAAQASHETKEQIIKILEDDRAEEPASGQPC